MGWTPEEAIGKTFSIWDKSGNIVGVIKDFHFKPLTASIEPFVFRYWPSESFQYLLLKLQPHRIQEGINTMEKIYKKFDPKTSIQYDFVNELVDNQYRTQQRSGKVVLYFSILTIFISCLGLFGLVTFSTDQKIKQIGIRKVLGASVQSIVQLLSQDFIKLVLVLAIIMAIPVSIWLISLVSNKEYSWNGNLFFPGLFDGEHKFELIDHGNGTTTFKHSEKFNGILVPLFKKLLDYNTKNGFEAMNRKLKELAELT